MKPGFEEKFMNIQTGLISLTLELTQGMNIEKVFVYGSIENGAFMFNAFVKKDGEITRLDFVGLDDDVHTQFLRIGIDDLKRLRDICKEHEAPTPTELKLYYDVQTGKFDSQYKYEPVTSMELGSSEVLAQWFEEERAKNQASLANASAEQPKKKSFFDRFR